MRSEDDAQEIMAQGLRNLQTYRPERGPLLGWAFGLVKRVRRRSFHQRQRYLELFCPDLGESERTPSPDESPEMALRRARLQKKLVIELSAMRRILLEPLVLVYFDGLSYEDAAAVLSVPQSTLKARLHRALEHLRVRFKGWDEDLRSVFPPLWTAMQQRFVLNPGWRFLYPLGHVCAGFMAAWIVLFPRTEVLTARTGLRVYDVPAMASHQPVHVPAALPDVQWVRRETQPLNQKRLLKTTTTVTRPAQPPEQPRTFDAVVEHSGLIPISGQ